jgi:anaerobic selenocysteine-containing dehydrogenase
MSTLPIRIVRGACPHDCPDTCATLVHVQGDRAVRFEGDPDHPVTRGWLCAKVRPYLERVYDPDRLSYPLRRAGAKGEDRWERITWDEAIGEIAGRWQAIIDRHGGAAILPYSFSGTLGVVQMTVANERLWNRMGASGLRRSICGAAAEMAVNYTMGAKWSVGPQDVPHSRMIVVWGHNPASTNPHFMPFLQEAQRAGAYLVVVDPRRTTTARRADLHLQPKPATDSALALGMIHVLFAENLHDEAWLEANTVGWRDLRDRAAEYDPERVAAITGIDAETIVAVARRWGATSPALLKFADGVQRHENGGQTVRALLALPAVTGQIGTRGGGVYYSTGGFGAWNGESVTHRSECLPTPRIINMNRLGAALTGEASDPPVMSLFVFGANPVAASPNSGLIVEGLLRDDLFTVVHEQFMTDTARYADIVLPATTQLEQQDVHRPYGVQNLVWNEQAIPPLGECKSNWDVMRLLASAMGYDEPWLHEEVEEVVAGILEASAKTNPLLAGITVERLKAEGAIPYAFPAPDWVPFSDGVFPTPSGKMELRCDRLATKGVDPLPEWIEPSEFRSAADGMLTLLTGAPHHFVSTSFANWERHERKEGTPFVEIHPEDAAARGIADGDEVRIENGRGWCRLRAVITEDVRPGVLVSLKGRWASHSPDGRTVNWTVPDAVGDMAGQSTYHSNRVWITPVASGAERADALASVAD